LLDLMVAAMMLGMAAQLLFRG
ncbi:amino acid transporter, partial [Pseudomonas aeruginosa]|nr:amino acid transporter [Pseudomonas aeruginosa]MCF3999679.1 amino acid transporter [Pseudomonas aeruginosa]